MKRCGLMESEESAVKDECTLINLKFSIIIEELTGFDAKHIIHFKDVIDVEVGKEFRWPSGSGQREQSIRSGSADQRQQSILMISVANLIAFANLDVQTNNKGQ